MSGFAFQKLNGGVTTANKQLGQLEAANAKLEGVKSRLDLLRTEVAALADYVSKPEIWKLARMFHPDATLTPVHWVRHQNGTGTISTDGKLYYGRLQLTLAVYNFKDRSRQWMEAGVWNNGHEQAKFMLMHYKNSHGDYPGVHQEYIGYIDAITVWSNCDSHGRFEFQGFEVGAAGSAPPPFVPPVEKEFELRVHGLSSFSGGSVFYFSGGAWHEVLDGVWLLPGDATNVRLVGVPNSVQYALYYNVLHMFASGSGDGGTVTLQFPADPDLLDFDVVFAPATSAVPPNPMAPPPPAPPAVPQNSTLFSVLSSYVANGYPGIITSLSFEVEATFQFMNDVSWVDTTTGALQQNTLAYDVLGWFNVFDPEPDIQVELRDSDGGLLLGPIGKDAMDASYGGPFFRVFDLSPYSGAEELEIRIYRL